MNIFTDNRKKKEQDKDQLIQELYCQVGRLKVELDWLKKNLGLSHKERLLLIDKTNKEIPISRQSGLLGVSRSSIYYKPLIDQYNLTLMHLIDEQYTRTPFYGSRKMTAFLNRNGHYVNRKGVQ